MNLKISSFIDKAKMSASGVRFVLSDLRYILLVLVLTVLFGQLLTISYYGTTKFNLLLSSIDMSEKVKLLVDNFFEFFTNFNSFWGALIIVVSVMQGIILALFIYNYRHNKKIDSSSFALTSFGSMAAILGFGCTACGTSLLMPLLTIILSSSAFTVISYIGNVMIFIAFALSIYGLWRLGIISFANYSAQAIDKKENKDE